MLDGGDGSHFAVGALDRTSLFVHRVRASGHDPDAVLATLTDAPEVLAASITDHVVGRASAPLAAGRFRREPHPKIHTQIVGPNEPDALYVGWSSSEEATGRPQLGLSIAVEATERGSRIVVLSAREPGYDLSRNRGDKAQRHQILQEPGAHVVDAVLRELPEAVAAREEVLPTGNPALRRGPCVSFGW